MKLLPIALIASAQSYARYPGARETQAYRTEFADWQAHKWYAVNDNVMGGVSSGNPMQNGLNVAFVGQLSMLNNGGFSTVRTDVADALDGACGLNIHLRGDGRTYQFTAYPGDMRGRYQMNVETVMGEDTSFQLKFDDLEYYFWGTQKPMKPLTVDNVKGIGFMVADKNTAPFALDILSIKPDRDCTVAKPAVPSGSGMMNMDWYSLNDDVMGGVSIGAITQINDFLVYSGQLSLANRGGFSTVRANVNQLDGMAKGVLIKVMGSEGRSFKLNLSKSTSDWDFNTWTYIMDVNSEWMTFKIPFGAFQHNIMGRSPNSIERIFASDIEKVSISISDKKTAPFQLTIAAIELYQ